MMTSLACRASCALALVLVSGLLSPVDAAPRKAESAPANPRSIAIYSGNQVQHGGPQMGVARAVADSFNIYGGRRSDGSNDRRPEGQFQTVDLAPRWQDWFGVDRTENPVFWHIDTFNAANLDTLVDNRALWSGVEAGTPGYATAPGYGNSWNDVLSWSGDTNPALFTNVRLAFDYNYDLEANYDFFYVEYDSAGSWLPWLVATGTNKEEDGTFQTAASFDEEVLYTPLMYAGPGNTEIRLRMRVVTDPGWSDEDGFNPSDGAAQIDNIRVWFDDNLVAGPGGDGIATFEDLGGTDDIEGWDPVPSAFAGDFAKVLINLVDIDPCRSILGPQLGFIDDGRPPSNSDNSTGGATSPNWAYGVRGNWVVNYTGGLSLGSIPLHNEVWSPVIDWDDPNSVEDDPLVGGAFIRFTVWQHLPLPNGMFWIWNVRSRENGEWTPWASRGFVYYGDGGGVYNNAQFDVTDLLSQNRDAVQLSLGVMDLADYFEVPGDDATPSPSFDNVSFWRYNVGGPAFSARNIDLFQDSFPNSGAVDPLNPALLSVRMDMAQDISGDVFNVPGDSIVVGVSATVPGSELAAMPTMEWVIDANPAFDAARTLPAGVTAGGTSTRGWPQWRGVVLGDSARTSSGVAVEGRFAFDLPNDGPGVATHHSDEPAMFFPGDRIRYFLRAEDTLGQVTTLPADTTGFSDGEGYARLFTIRALPSIVDDGGSGFTHPEILVVNDFGHRGGENEWLIAMAQNGLTEDVDYDTYTVRGPSSLVSNGIGSAGAHGANADQLRGYNTMIYFAGNLASGLMSDGSGSGSNDKGDDLDVLNQWHSQPDHRYAVYFGDYIATGLLESGLDGTAYLNNVLGVDYNDDSVRDEIGGQSAPLVVPQIAQFTTSYVAFGGCLAINEFDSIFPLPGAVTSHAFTDENGLTPYAAAASVYNARVDQILGDDWNRVTVTFPYGFSYVYESLQRSVGVASRVVLMGEILDSFGHPVSPAATSAPVNRRLEVARNNPNPFNPETTIAFSAPDAGRLRVRVYNLRGEVVRVLHDGHVDAGAGTVIWDGTDQRGSAVSSGVYLYEVTGFGQRISGKMALVK